MQARFDRYDVLAALGAGGMGEVVKARALGPHGFEKIVAIKRIRAEWSAQESMAERFIREARIAARLQHANIVQVFDFGRHGDELFIVMEYVDGQSLDAILAALRAEGKRPTLAQTLQIGLDVARALDCAHTLADEDGTQAGIIHRDVSPANILVSRTGLVKLTDFGIAAWSSQQGRTSMVAGKPLYMAPEQLRGDALDGRADLFAVGIVLYEMLTGERPWKGMVDPSPDATLEAMEYRPPSALMTNAPAELDGLLARLLAPNASDRMASARELTKEILQLSYGCRIVLDPSELTPLIRDPSVSDAHAPTLPQYVDKVHTLVATGVSPDGVTLLKTEDDPPVGPAPSTRPPSRPVPAWIWAAVAAILLGAGTGAAVWVTTADPPGDGTTYAAASGSDDAIDPASESEPAMEPDSGAPIETEPAQADPPSEPDFPLPPAGGGRGEGARSATDIPIDRDPETSIDRDPPRGPRRTTPIERTATSEPTGQGELDVFSRPWAEIWIDGERQRENAPARGLRLSAGRHRVRLVNPVLGLSQERTVVVPADGRAQLRVFLDQNTAEPEAE